MKASAGRARNTSRGLSARRSKRRSRFRRRRAEFLEALSGKKKLVGLLVFSGLTMLLVLAAVLGEQGLFKVWHLSQQRSAMVKRIAVLELETKRLRLQAREWKTDTYPYEKAARERLGMIRPGEVVYDFRSDPLEARP